MSMMGFTLGSVLPNEVRCLVSNHFPLIQKNRHPSLSTGPPHFRGMGVFEKLIMILVIFLVYPDVDEHFIILTSF